MNQLYCTEEKFWGKITLANGSYCRVGIKTLASGPCCRFGEKKLRQMDLGMDRVSGKKFSF